MKFSLAALLFMVLLAAIGCAALVNANDTWRQTIVTLALSVLLIATLTAAVHRSRAFAWGFAVAGWVYLLLAFVPVFDLRDDLLTDKALRWLFTAIHDEVAQQSSQSSVAFTPNGQILIAGSQVSIVRLNSRSRALIKPKTQAVRVENFGHIGHALWVLIVACLGGAVAAFLARKSNRESPSTPTISESRLSTLAYPLTTGELSLRSYYHSAAVQCSSRLAS